ncbi:MAG: sugar transferase [Roseovarius sp.]|jgi:lipopolysaccharide/colanic/teichoic acid biosynthesis glycosyltransferase|nr:sugar transferase [Roseovarius sp.]
MYLGVAGIVLLLGKCHAQFIGLYDLTGSGRFAWFFAYIAVLSLAAYALGLPELVRSRKSAIATGVAAAGVGALGISVVQLFVGDALLPRFVVFGSALLLPGWYATCSLLAAGGRSRAEERDRVVVVASDAEVHALRQELEAHPERPASIVADLRVVEALPGNSDGAPLAEAVRLAEGKVLVLDRAAQTEQSIVAQAASLHETGVRIRTLSLFYEEWLGKLPISELERVSLMFDIGEIHRVRYTRAKRIVDVALALCGLLLLCLVIVPIMMGNIVANRGPLFYRQTRVGKGGSEFTILKFRTMIPQVSGHLHDEWTSANDPRVTSFGRVLRRTHLDELPQVTNILRGDLSVVGPRPEQPSYVHDLSLKLPFYPLRHLVRPGLTGWAQVKYGYAASDADAMEKLQYEFWYLRHQDVVTDLRIIGRTLRSFGFGDGR